MHCQKRYLLVYVVMKFPRDPGSLFFVCFNEPLKLGAGNLHFFEPQDFL
jgi:hypothetical protein